MDKQFRIVVTAFIINDSKLLAIKRPDNSDFLPGSWDMPGGHLEFGEEPKEALKREVREETGLDIIIGEPFEVFTYISSQKDKQTVEIIYLARASNPDNIKLSDEHVAFKWIVKEDVSQHFPVNDKMGKFVENALSKTN